MKDAQILVLNSLYQPAGVGELGEIFMRSPHMRFVDEPHINVTLRMQFKIVLDTLVSLKQLRRNF